MRHSDLHKLPPAVRGRYLNLTPDHFAEHPDVLELTRRAAEAEAQQQPHIERLKHARQRQAEVLAKRDQATATVAIIDAQRPALLARLLLAGDDLAEDARQQEQRSKAALFAEAVTVDLPAMVEIELDLVSANRKACWPLERIEDERRVLIERLRLEAANKPG